jgi:hypothetical protein
VCHDSPSSKLSQLACPSWAAGDFNVVTGIFIHSRGAGQEENFDTGPRDEFNPPVRFHTYARRSESKIIFPATTVAIFLGRQHFASSSSQCRRRAVPSDLLASKATSGLTRRCICLTFNSRRCLRKQTEASLPVSRLPGGSETSSREWFLCRITSAAARLLARGLRLKDCLRA